MRDAFPDRVALVAGTLTVAFAVASGGAAIYRQNRDWTPSGDASDASFGAFSGANRSVVGGRGR